MKMAQSKQANHEAKILQIQKCHSLTPKGPRPFFCEKTLKTAISITMSKKF